MEASTANPGVDALKSLCDRLKASLAAADTRRRLLDALLHEALSETFTTTSEEAA